MHPLSHSEAACHCLQRPILCIRWKGSGPRLRMLRIELSVLSSIADEPSRLDLSLICIDSSTRTKAKAMVADPGRALTASYKAFLLAASRYF